VVIVVVGPVTVAVVIAVIVELVVWVTVDAGTVLVIV
jgi:hypothetical protein